ncbi:MAG: ester cyclase [Dehalococcoidia bacterium]|nr:ester cyclase [Dehalococcoidia bacterium]
MSDAASIARELIDAWNRRDFARYRQLLHSDYSYTGGDGQTQKGPEAGLAVAQMYATAFPDAKSDVQRIHAAGDVAIAEFIARGTHQGDLMGIAPTGRRVEVPICNVIEVRDGKVYAEREYFDVMHMMQQLGVVPAAATA